MKDHPYTGHVLYKLSKQRDKKLKNRLPERAGGFFVRKFTFTKKEAAAWRKMQEYT